MGEKLYLANIPAEVLSLICSKLCTHCIETGDGRQFSPHTLIHVQQEIVERQSALAALCQSSKLFCQVAQPYLYHFIHLNTTTSHSFPSLIKTLISRHDLSSHIKWVETGNYGSPDVSPGLADQFSSAAAQCNVLLPHGWHGNRRLKHGVLMELFLLHARHASTFSITTDPSLRFAHLTTRSSPSSAAPSFPALKTLHLQHYDTEGGFTLDNTKSLIEASPNLGTLCLSNCSRFTGPIDLTSVFHLRLECCSSLPQEEVTELIRSCRNLEVFNMWSRDSQSPDWARGARCTSNDVLRVLRNSHKESLTSLGLDFDDTRWSSSAPASQDPIRTLQDFEKLECLWINHRTVEMMGAGRPKPASVVHILPESIKRLHLNNFPCTSSAELEQLVAAVEQGRFPNLTEVAVRQCDGANPEPDRQAADDWISLHDRLRGRGVNMSERLMYPMLPLSGTDPSQGDQGQVE